MCILCVACFCSLRLCSTFLLQRKNIVVMCTVYVIWRKKKHSTEYRIKFREQWLWIRTLTKCSILYASHSQLDIHSECVLYVLCVVCAYTGNCNHIWCAANVQHNFKWLLGKHALSAQCTVHTANTVLSSFPQSGNFILHFVASPMYTIVVQIIIT